MSFQRARQNAIDGLVDYTYVVGSGSTVPRSWVATGLIRTDERELPPATRLVPIGEWPWRRSPTYDTQYAILSAADSLREIGPDFVKGMISPIGRIANVARQEETNLVRFVDHEDVVAVPTGVIGIDPQFPLGMGLYSNFYPPEQQFPMRHDAVATGFVKVGDDVDTPAVYATLNDIHVPDFYSVINSRRF